MRNGGIFWFGLMEMGRDRKKVYLCFLAILRGIVSGETIGPCGGLKLLKL